MEDGFVEEMLAAGVRIEDLPHPVPWRRPETEPQLALAWPAPQTTAGRSQTGLADIPSGIRHMEGMQFGPPRERIKRVRGCTGGRTGSGR